MSTPQTDLRQAGLINTLRGCRLFAELPSSDLTDLAGITGRRRLAKNEYLFHEGEPSEGFFVVQRGAVNVHRVSLAGREQVIHIFRAGDSFAEATLAPKAPYPANARALEETRVLLIRRADFIKLLKRQPDLGLRLVASLSLRLRTLLSQIDDLTLKDVEGRLARWLVVRCPDPRSERPVSVRLPGTKRVLAAELGTVSETLSRTLAKMRTKKLLKVQGRTVVVLNPVQLARRAEGTDG